MYTLVDGVPYENAQVPVDLEKLRTDYVRTQLEMTRAEGTVQACKDYMASLEAKVSAINEALNLDLTLE